MSAEGSVESGKPTVEKKEARRTSRRDFLCLGAGLAVGAAATYLAMPQPLKETFSGKGATKVKITVLRTSGMNEVFPKGLPVKPKYSGACPILTEGQEFIVDAERPLKSTKRSLTDWSRSRLPRLNGVVDNMQGQWDQATTILFFFDTLVPIIEFSDRLRIRAVTKREKFDMGWRLIKGEMYLNFVVDWAHRLDIDEQDESLKLAVCLHLFDRYGLLQVEPASSRVIFEPRLEPLNLKDLVFDPNLLSHKEPARFQGYLLTKINEMKGSWKHVAEKPWPDQAILAGKRLLWVKARREYEDKLVDLMIAFEALLLKRYEREKGELIARRAARLIETDTSILKNTCNELSTAYQLRNDIVHEGAPDFTRLKGYFFERFVEFVEVYLRRTLQEFVMKSISRR